MGPVVIRRRGLMARGMIVALIQTGMLRRLGRGLWPLDDDGRERLRAQCGVVHVGSGRGDPQGTAIGFHDEAALHPFFPRSVGLRPTRSPPMRALPMAASAACHCQSTPPNASQACTRVAQIRSKTPSSHQRWKCRCTVLSSPNGSGSWCHWQPGRRWTVAVDGDRRFVVAQTARRGPTNGCATRRPRVDAAHHRMPMAPVVADAECGSGRHHQPVRQALQAHRVIPAKRDGAAWRLQGGRAQMRQECPEHRYHRHALIESLIATVKRQLSRLVHQAAPSGRQACRHDSWASPITSTACGIPRGLES
jgi:hypothetical protein